MRSDRAEIEAVLLAGKDILSKRPELATMVLDSVIDELDDGTPEMIRDRLGVAAQIVIGNINDWSLKSLVEQLSKIDSGCLTYEYAGYLLQAEYDVDMEALLLEADNQGQFLKISEYISPNLRFLTKIRPEHILPLLHMLEKHKEKNIYHALIRNYADGIAANDGFSLAIDSLSEISTFTQYNFVCQLRHGLFKKDISEANNVLNTFFAQNGVWSKKAAIAFVEAGLCYDRNIFKSHFPKLEHILLKNQELWLEIIPVFVEFLITATEKDITNPTYLQTLEYIKKIPCDTTNAKLRFIQSLEWQQCIPTQLHEIFESILSTPFNDNLAFLLETVDHYLYRMVRNGQVDLVIQLMFKVFQANEYRGKYNEYFSKLGSTRHELSQKIEIVIPQALEYLLSADSDKMFFGLGLFLESGSIQKGLEASQKLCTNTELIRLMKAVLYFSYDGSKVCHIAFQLLVISSETSDEYIAFCMDEVYENYPSTMHAISLQYKSSIIKAQVQLAELINERHEQLLVEQEKIQKINDFLPSVEHQHIYRRAQLEINHQIHSKAKEQSFFAQFFPMQCLKYGVRSAHIVRGAKGQKFFQSAPYQHIKQEYELPSTYVNDPVKFVMQRQSFLEEVINNAADS